MADKEKIVLAKAFENIFVPNRKCITNADLDGLISAILLQKYLHWEVVGYSYCGGTKKDTLWMKEGCTIFVLLSGCTVSTTRSASVR